MANEKSTAEEVKPPNPAVVERAQEKVDSGKELNQREEKALEDQAAIDKARGYTEEEWKPGVRQFRSLITGHTTSGANAERDMIQYHAELDKHGIADPRA